MVVLSLFFFAENYPTASTFGVALGSEERDYQKTMGAKSWSRSQLERTEVPGRYSKTRETWSMFAR
jgi:hypothetical protein